MTVEKRIIKGAEEWLQFTRNADIFKMARIHIMNLLAVIEQLKTEIKEEVDGN